MSDVDTDTPPSWDSIPPPSSSPLLANLALELDEGAELIGPEEEEEDKGTGGLLEVVVEIKCIG